MRRHAARLNTIPEDFIAKVEVAGSKPVSRSTLVLRVQFELERDRKWQPRWRDESERVTSQRAPRPPKTPNKVLLLGRNALFQHCGQTSIGHSVQNARG